MFISDLKFDKQNFSVGKKNFRFGWQGVDWYVAKSYREGDGETKQAGKNPYEI